MAEEYPIAIVREYKLKSGKRWRGVLKYQEENPKYVEQPDGEDNRTKEQKQRLIWKQVTKIFKRVHGGAYDGCVAVMVE